MTNVQHFYVLLDPHFSQKLCKVNTSLPISISWKKLLVTNMLRYFLFLLLLSDNCRNSQRTRWLKRCWLCFNWWFYTYHKFGGMWSFPPRGWSNGNHNPKIDHNHTSYRMAWMWLWKRRSLWMDYWTFSTRGTI